MPPSRKVSWLSTSGVGLLFFFLREERGWSLAAAFCHRNLSLQRQCLSLTNGISLLAISVTLRSKGLLIPVVVIGCFPQTDKLVCGTAKKKVSSYQN